MTEQIFIVIITAILGVIGFFLIKTFNRIDDLAQAHLEMKVGFARIEGKLDAGAEKMKSQESDINRIDGKLEQHDLLIHGLNSRLGNVEVKCGLNHSK